MPIGCQSCTDVSVHESDHNRLYLYEMVGKQLIAISPSHVIRSYIKSLTAEISCLPANTCRLCADHVPLLKYSCYSRVSHLSQNISHLLDNVAHFGLASSLVTSQHHITASHSLTSIHSPHCTSRC